MDRIEAIEPTKVAKENRSPRSYNRLGFVCVALLWVLAQGADALDHGWPSIVLGGFVAVVCLVGYFAFVAGAVGEYLQKCFVVEARLSNGKSILLQLYGDPDSFLSTFRSVSDHDRSVS